MRKHTFGLRFAAGKVDRAAGVIHGVAVITKGTARGHDVGIDDTTLRQIKECAATYSGGLKVVAKHTKPAESPFFAAGYLRNFAMDGDILRADLHVLKSEENRDKLFEMAEEIPDTFGISVAFAGVDEVIGGKTFARCEEIYNAALVDMPAANPTGLFAAGDIDAGDRRNSPDMTPDEIKIAIKAEVQTALVEFSGRIKAVEDKAASLAPSTELAALNKTVTELSTGLEKARKEFADGLGNDAKRLELAAQVVAKEFAGKLGNGVLHASPAGGGGGGGGDGAEKQITDFDAELTKQFAATKSKPRAWALAMDKDPNGYAAFIASKRKPAFEKVAA